MSGATVSQTQPTLDELAGQLAALQTEVDQLRQHADGNTLSADSGGGSDGSPATRGVREEHEPQYDGVEAWVRDWLLVNFSRPWGEVGTVRWCWCERWWEHNEAMLRLTALWYGWESARLDQTGMMSWLREMDYQMQVLCGPDGPFRDCNPQLDDKPPRHRGDDFAPVEPAPPGWFDWWPEQTEVTPTG